MKLNRIFIVLGIFVLIINSCKKSKVDRSQFTIPIDVLENCEFGDRKNTKKIREMIVRVEREEPNIIFKAGIYRYVACNIDESNLPINDTIIISGYEKKMYPNEFWVGQPIQLTSAFKR